MIKIRDISNEIVENCFGEDEKTILEFTQGKLVMNVENQFLRYYRTACYPSTKQDLFRDVAFIIEDNRILLEKIKKAKELLSEILDPGNWAEVKFHVGSSKSEGSNINSSTSKSKTDSLHREGGTSKGQSDSASIERSEGANSETNELISLDDVFAALKINHEILEPNNIQLDETETIWKPGESPQQSPATAPKTPIPQLEITEAKKDPLYQNYTKGNTSSEDTAKSYTETEGKSIDKDSSTTDGASSGFHKNQAQRGNITRTARMGEEAIEALNSEITALRSKFWHKFYPLFKYERNY